MPPLWRIRRLKGFTQQSLADAAGVSKMTVYEIEAGRTIPQAETIQALSAALGVDPADVDEFTRPPKRSRHADAPPASDA
jgi:transcriptional regulator with XRE-family HTH domain